MTETEINSQSMGYNYTIEILFIVSLSKRKRVCESLNAKKRVIVDIFATIFEIKDIF